MHEELTTYEMETQSLRANLQVAEEKLAKTASEVVKESFMDDILIRAGRRSETFCARQRLTDKRVDSFIKVGSLSTVYLCAIREVEGAGEDVHRSRQELRVAVRVLENQNDEISSQNRYEARCFSFV